MTQPITHQARGPSAKSPTSPDPAMPLPYCSAPTSAETDPACRENSASAPANESATIRPVQEMKTNNGSSRPHNPPVRPGDDGARNAGHRRDERTCDQQAIHRKASYQASIEHVGRHDPQDAGAKEPATILGGKEVVGDIRKGGAGDVRKHPSEKKPPAPA